MLVYSAATAKAYSVYHKTKVMSTSQKEQLYRAFKKYAIEEFKRTEKLMSYNYDGRTKFLDISEIHLYMINYLLGFILILEKM